MPISNGRQIAAWLGLMPRQNSSGRKTTLLGISKRRDSYLRMLLILCARLLSPIQTIPSLRCMASKGTPLVSGYTNSTTKNCTAIMTAKNTNG